MIVTCSYCNDTGSLQKDLYSDLDCTHCEIAVERAEFKVWLINITNYHGFAQVAWLAQQRGKILAQTNKKD